MIAHFLAVGRVRPCRDSVPTMRLSFGPNDEEAFFAARDRLASRFESSARGPDLGWVAAQILDLKWGYLDGDLTRWLPEEIEEILLELVPAKVMLEPEDLDLVIDGFAGFLRFLADESILPRDQSARLADLVERLAPRFRRTALDEANWSPGKRLWSLARSEGVDPSDPEAVQRFMDDFNRRPWAERDAVLGPLPDRHLPRTTPPEPLPPVALRPRDELEAAARGSVWYERLCRLVGYVGDGLPLTQRGNLTLAHGKALVGVLGTRDRFDEAIGDRVFKTRSSADLSELDLAFRVAIGSGMLRRRGGRVLPGPGAGWVGDPLAVMYQAWLALLTVVGPTQHRYRGHHYGWDWYAPELDASLVGILVEMYRYGAIPMDEMAQDLWDHLLDVYDLEDVPADKLAFHRGLVDSSLRRAFDLLGELSMVEVEGVVEVPNRYRGTDRTGGTAALTPLGTWAMQRFAAHFTSAPVVGSRRESGAAELLRAVSDRPEAEAVAEIDAWVEHRGDGAAAALVEALPTLDATGRGLGFRALLRLGPGAAAAVERLAADPDLAAYATVWRVDSLTAAPEEMDCAGDPERFVRLLGAALDLWGPTAAVAAWAGPAAGGEGLVAMLEGAWRVRRPETDEVLAAIGREHPDKVIAAAARKALFKHRSSG